MQQQVAAVMGKPGGEDMCSRPNRIPRRTTGDLRKHGSSRIGPWSRRGRPTPWDGSRWQANAGLREAESGMPQMRVRV